MKKHGLLALGVALLSASSLIGCNQKTITVTFDAGIGTFPDGSRTKTIKAKAHTKISDLNLPAPSYEGYTTNSWLDNNGSEADFVDDVMSYVAKYGVNFTQMKAAAIGKVAGSMMDAIARQPEIESQFRAAFAKMQFYFNAFTDGLDAIALAMTGSGFMDALARQPEAQGKLEDALFYTCEVLLNCSKKDGRSIGAGKVGKSTMDAIARRPEAEAVSKIIQSMSISYEGIYASHSAYGAAYGIGKAGGSAADAIARQPEASSKIIDNLKLTVYYINHVK